MREKKTELFRTNGHWPSNLGSNGPRNMIGTIYNAQFYFPTGFEPLLRFFPWGLLLLTFYHCFTPFFFIQLVQAQKKPIMSPPTSLTDPCETPVTDRGSAVTASITAIKQLFDNTNDNDEPNVKRARYLKITPEELSRLITA
jgi:hypothetical protein